MRSERCGRPRDRQHDAHRDSPGRRRKAARLFHRRIDGLHGERDQRRDDRREGDGLDSDRAGRGEQRVRMRKVEPAEREKEWRKERGQRVEQQGGAPARNVRAPQEHPERHAEKQRARSHRACERARAQEEQPGSGARKRREARQRRPGDHREEREERRHTDHESGECQRQMLLGTLQSPTHCRSQGWILSISSPRRA